MNLLRMFSYYTLKGWEASKKVVGLKRKTLRLNVASRNKDIVDAYVPTLSLHALKRISERLQNPRKLRKYVMVNWERVAWDERANWIHPALLKKVLRDVKSSVKVYAYSRKYDSILTKGTLARYIIGRWGEVITVITDMKLEKNYKADKEFTAVDMPPLDSFLWIEIPYSPMEE